MRFVNLCNRIIEYSFYLLFFLVPLVIASDTSELFEFNKMWLTFGITVIIGMAWLTKMVIQRKIFIQRTPLDIPIALFLASQFVSTIFSWDIHISIWGYYSRFNGSLLSILTYVFLYYAYLSNLYSIKIVKRLLVISLLSGLVVALWGLPSHFGYDPTCFLFRQTLDVSCWTEDFQPKIRIFSTLGQPDWLAAYLAILLPISIIMFIKFIKNLPLSIFPARLRLRANSLAGGYFLLSVLFYLDLLYTRARSGILAVWLSLAFFVVLILVVKREFLKLSILLIVFLSITFFIGTPFSQISKFTLEGMKAQFAKTKIENTSKTPRHFGQLGGTDSGKIRRIVWKGAINAWVHHPLFGTGVETFAFAYYRYKEASGNLTSEWNFLYNKAHNEYLNYLATTGAFGLGTYLLMIGAFMFLFFKHLNPKRDSGRASLARMTSFWGAASGGATPESPSFRASSMSDASSIFEFRILKVALITSYISILITNFFGFSVVITNIYLFMIPAFIFILGGRLNSEKSFVFPQTKSQPKDVSIVQWVGITILILITLYLIYFLFRFWLADKNYSLGYNLNRAGEYLQANPYLRKAVHLRNEPVFKDELAVSDVMLAIELLSQKKLDENKENLKKANNLAQEAIGISNQLTANHEHNVVFWKTKTRIFYNLSQIDSQYLPLSLNAIQKAASLSPNDASISYNLGVLYGQNNDIKKAIEVLENTIKLKSDYQDAHYALGLFYREEAVDEKGVVVNESYQQKAIEQMQYIIDNFPNNSGAKDALKGWGRE